MSYHWWLTTAKNPGWCSIDDIFTDDELVKIIKMGSDNNLSTPTEAKIGSKTDDKKNTDVRKSKISWIRTDVETNIWLFKKLTDVITQVNNNVFNFDIEYIQNLQFTEYNIGDFYGHHTDIAYESDRSRKLSFSIQLSDESTYDGGNLKLYCGEPFTVPRKKSTITIFPSYVLHEVEPVNKGVRYALVGWIVGPKFR